MLVFPYCKINLGLRVLGKRPDGFHDLKTVFYPVGIRDALEMLPLATDPAMPPAPDSHEPSLHITGQDIPGDPRSNLCIKAYELLKADFPAVRPVDIYLHKQIPMGAGLGGGSADGAFALRLLNRLFRLGLTEEQLLPYALALGSDCPFFLYDGPCSASGRGEILQPIGLDLSAYRLVLVNPGIHVNTGWAFSQLEPGVNRGPGLEPAPAGFEPASWEPADGTSLPPMEQWKSRLRNDFEIPVFRAHPEIGQIKDALYAQGAVYASMSGSGSTVFGLFTRKINLPSFKFPSNYWVSFTDIS
jgi:4-diphosphocytidyl-2-C-methyl-D-erythritol kinase